MHTTTVSGDDAMLASGSSRSSMKEASEGSKLTFVRAASSSLLHSPEANTALVLPCEAVLNGTAAGRGAARTLSATTQVWERHE